MATKPLDPKQAQKALDAEAAHDTKVEAARSLGLKVSTFKDRLRVAREMGLTPGGTPPAPEPTSTIDPTVVRLQDELTRVRRELKEMVRDNLSAESVREQIMGLSDARQSPPAWLVDPKIGTSITGVPSCLWSDWHLGEKVSAEEVNGINEYDLTIAERRIRTLVERTVDLCQNHMTQPEYPGVVVNLGGDMISGELHPELAENDELELNQQILWAVDRLIWALDVMADKFGRVFVPCAPGNHGRMFDRKPRAKKYVYRNADWLIYTMLERHFQAVGDTRVTFMIPATGEALYRVYGHRYMLVHGDDLGVRGGDGIIGAIGPIMRGEIKMHHSQAQIGRDYDTLLMGHWHQALLLPRAIVNNTLKGYDEFARRFLRAVPSAPSQLLWFTHPRRGITARWEVLVDSQQVAEPAPWLSIPQAERTAA